METAIIKPAYPEHPEDKDRVWSFRGIDSDEFDDRNGDNFISWRINLLPGCEEGEVEDPESYLTDSINHLVETRELIRGLSERGKVYVETDFYPLDGYYLLRIEVPRTHPVFNGYYEE